MAHAARAPSRVGRCERRVAAGGPAEGGFALMREARRRWGSNMDVDLEHWTRFGEHAFTERMRLQV